MINKRLFEVEMDITELKKDFYLGPVKQLDATRIMLSLYNDGLPMELKGAMATIYAVRPSGEVVYQTLDIAIPDDFNIVQIDCKNSIFQETGVVRLECEIFDDDGYKVTSPNFTIEVVPRLNDLDVDEILPGDDIDFISDLLRHAKESEEILSELEDLLDELGSDQNTILKNLLEVKRLINSMLPEINGEVSRLDSAINAAKQADVNFSNNEYAREVSEYTRATAENIRIAAEEVRNENEEGRQTNTENKINDCENRMQVIEETFEALVDGSGYASIQYVDNSVKTLVDSSPVSLNTLGKIAKAIKDDPEFYDKIMHSISLLEDKLKEKSDINHFHSNVYTKTEVDELVSAGQIDLSWVASKNDLAAKADYNHVHEDYADSEYVLMRFGELESQKANRTELHTHSNLPALSKLTDAKMTYWDNKSSFSGNYNDLTNKPSIPVVDVNKGYVDNRVGEINAQLSKKMDATNAYTKTEIDALIESLSQRISALESETPPPPTYELTVVPKTYTGQKGKIAYIEGSCTYPNVHYYEVMSESDGWVGVANVLKNGKFELELPAYLSTKTYFNCLLEARDKDDNTIAYADNTFHLIVMDEEVADIPVSSVSLNKSSHTFSSLTTTQLTSTILPSNATNKNVTWHSSNSSVATVNNGLVTAKGNGSAIVTVTTVDGNKTATCNITVNVSAPTKPVTSVGLEPTRHTFTKLNDTVQLTASIFPWDATNKNVTWSTSNSSVATVSNGLVTAKGSGNAVITVTTQDGNKTATCNIIVETGTTPPTPPPPTDLVEGKMYRSIAYIPYPHEDGYGAWDGIDQFKDYNYGTALICLPVDCKFTTNQPICDVRETLINSICNKLEGMGVQPILKMHTVSLQEDGQGNVDKPNNAQTWFANYRVLVNTFADIVVKRGYKEFIISNEMHNVMNLASNKQYMLPIINDVKAKGLRVSMSMNTPEVVENDGFQFFNELDFYCMNTYPALTHNNYSNEWARNNFATLRNGFYTVENSLDMDYATLFKDMGGANNLHKEIWLTEVGANTSNKTLEYPAYWGDSSDPKTNYEGQKHWLHAVFDVLEKDRQTGKLPKRVSRYMLWDGNFGSNFNPIGKMGQEVLDMYWKDEEGEIEPPPPTPSDTNYFDINNTLWEESECNHTVNTANKTITVSSDRNVDKYYGFLAWDISKIREGRRYRFTCKSSNSMSFVRFRVDGERIVDVGFKNEYSMDFTGVNAQEKLVDICLGIRQPQNENIGLITSTFSDIKLIDLDGDPGPLPEGDIQYDVVDYKIIVKKNGITESYHSNEDIPRNLDGHGGIDGYKLVIKDRIKHYLSLTKGASNSRITIDGMKPFNYTYIDQAWKSKWLGVGYSIFHNTLKFTIANRVDKGEWGDVEDRTINPVSLEKGIKIFNCALPGYMEVKHDQNSPNSISEGYFETMWLGICRLNHYKGEKFHIHQNIKLLGGFGNSTRFYVSVLVHELGHVTGIPDNSPHYPTSYLYNKEDREPEWLQPSDIAHIQDKFPHLTGRSTEVPKDFKEGIEKNVLFSFMGYENEDDMLDNSTTAIEARFVDKEEEGLWIYGLDYNLYNFEVTKVLKGGKQVKEMIQIKEHESFDLELEKGKEYRLYLMDFEKTQSCLLNPKQAIIKI